jgi:hypothetical protein
VRCRVDSASTNIERASARQLPALAAALPLVCNRLPIIALAYTYNFARTYYKL